MNLKYYWYCYDSVVSPRICNEIIKLLNKTQKQRATIGAVKDGKKKMSKRKQKFFDKTRQSTVGWRNDPWLYRYTHPWIRQANEQAGWNFEWSRSEDCQLTEYGPDQFYTWHVDQHPDPYNDGSFKGLTRKLSSVLVLNDATEYEGGKLEFWNRSENKRNNLTSPEPMLKKGSIVVFPSFVWHRVTPVTKGKRYSLTNWHCGRPYV